ncbi:MAG: PP2C family protein-serine/threonine phosphatase [Lachnospiraceae bacterium]|nr:PP2C family protein-serine/threonine phosphatase [Lachnospiraceae bacterium]
MKVMKKIRSSLSVNIIGGIILLLIVFGLIVSVIGYFSFTDAFKTEYSTTTYHMADTATTLINGDHVDDYLAGKEVEEYERTKGYLDAYCVRMRLSIVYLIKVDTSDYGRFVSIFNSVDNTVDNSTYTPWELGYQRDTTNNEYRRKYQNLYEKKSAYETLYRMKTTDGAHPHITTIVPVKNAAGDVTALLCVQRPARELEDARRPYLIIIAISTALLAILSGLSAALYIRKHFVDPVEKVSNEAARFAKENTKGEPLGQISKFQVFSNLANSIDTMETDMVNYIDNLTAVTSEKERIGAELSLAKTIQENSVPNIFPAFPERAEFDVYASMTPAKEVGGDFYNFFLVDEDHLAMVIGDVSGKGIPAALFMMVTNILISDRTHMGGTPAEILGYVNDNLYSHNRAEMFVTLWLGILEISTGKIIMANAGHEDAAVYHKNTNRFELFKTKHGFVAGALSGVKYQDFEIQLEKGDKVFLYTDGVPEATNGEEKMFTLDAMVDTLNHYKESAPQEILQGISVSVDAFVGDAPQFDDLTMLCLEWK